MSLSALKKETKKLAMWGYTHGRMSKWNTKDPFNGELSSFLDKLLDGANKTSLQKDYLSFQREYESQNKKTDSFDEDDVEWITVNGAHIPLDDDGTALGGGDLKGKNFINAKSEKRTQKSISGSDVEKVKTNHYTPIEREALRNPAIAMAVLMSSGELTAQDYVELVQSGKAVERATEYVTQKYASLGERYEACQPAQKRIMEMSTEEFKKYVDDACGKEIDNSLNTKSKLQHVVAEAGLDAKPKVVGAEEFEKIASESPSGKMYRGVTNNAKAGVTADDVVDMTIYGDKTFVGDGMHSDGIYFSTVKATADSYAANGGKVMTACVSPDARVVWYNDLMKMKGDHVSDPNMVNMDTGVFAMYLGYNCIELEPVSGDKYYIAIDRSALVFCDERTDETDSKRGTIDGAALAESFNAFAFMSSKSGITENITAESEKNLDFSPENNTIKSQETSEDGAPKGNQNAAGPHKRSHLSKADQEKYTKRIVGQKTSDGTTVTGFWKHAFDRIAQRNVSMGQIEKLLQSSQVSPDKTYPNRTCYDIPGKRLVLDKNTGEIVTIEWRQQNK